MKRYRSPSTLSTQIEKLKGSHTETEKHLKKAFKDAAEAWH